MPVTHESFCSPRPSASASPYTVYIIIINHHRRRRSSSTMMPLPTGDNHRPRAPCLESAVSVGDETVDGMTAILGYARVSTTGQDSKNRPFFAR